MNQTMYTAISGMNAFQQALSVTSNNIANANTTGYKNKASFSMIYFTKTQWDLLQADFTLEQTQ